MKIRLTMGEAIWARVVRFIAPLYPVMRLLIFPYLSPERFWERMSAHPCPGVDSFGARNVPARRNVREPEPDHTPPGRSPCMLLLEALRAELEKPRKTRGVLNDHSRHATRRCADLQRCATSSSSCSIPAGEARWPGRSHASSGECSAGLRTAVRPGLCLPDPPRSSPLS